MSLQLPEGWRYSTLAEVVELQRGFDLPSHARRPGNYPVLTSGEGGGWHDEGPIEGPGFIVGRATNLGRPKWSAGAFWPHNTTMFAKDFKGNNPRWLFHLFESIDLSGFDSGSVQPMLNRNYIAQVRVAVPPAPEQNAIAEVLGALDDKIAANSALAATAEAMGVTLLQPLTTSVPLSELASVSKTSVNPALFRQELVDHFSLPAFDNNQMPVTEVASGIRSNKFAITAPTVLLSKLNPRFPRVWRADPGNGRRSIASTEFLVLTAVGTTRELLWAALAQPAFASALDAKVAGTSGSHQRVRPEDALATPVLDPRLLKDTEARAIASLLMLASTMRNENQMLAETRDALLPQLMSGRLRVRDAEKVAADAGA